MSDVNLEEVIANAVSDSELPTETPEVSDDTSTDVPVEATETASDETVSSEEGSSEGIEVRSPGAAAQTPAEKDEFEKKFGIPAQSNSGRENRIPHSRVQQIVAKAVKDSEAAFTPKLKEFEAKVVDYEARLHKVAEFESLMVNDSQKFLQLLNQLPQYQELLRPLFQPAQAQTQQQAVEDDGMPQPDQQLSDGSLVYSMEGLRALNAWNREQSRKETLAEVDKRFGPIEQSYQSYRTLQELAPKVQAQITEARTWPLFNENEAEITQALQQDGRLSLEGAYRRVVFPKITAERTSMRESILKEIKSAPASTSAPSRSSRPGFQSPGGKRTIEDIIKEQVDNAGLR